MELDYLQLTPFNSITYHQSKHTLRSVIKDKNPNNAHVLEIFQISNTPCLKIPKCTKAEFAQIKIAYSNNQHIYNRWIQLWIDIYLTYKWSEFRHARQ